MNANPDKAPRCSAVIDGPKYGRIVEWRRNCQNRTRHLSGRCPYHRGWGMYVGETKAQYEERNR
jgi:hypothetical protein